MSTHCPDLQDNTEHFVCQLLANKNTSVPARTGTQVPSSAKQQSPAWPTALRPLAKHLQSNKSLKCQARSEVSHLNLTQGRFFLLLAASTAWNSFNSDRVTGREVSFPIFPWKLVWKGFSSSVLRLRKGGFGGGWKTEAEKRLSFGPRSQAEESDYRWKICSTKLSIPPPHSSISPDLSCSYSFAP